MDAALELFANHGYYDTSISRIAEKAGISKGLLYNYFSGKEELVIEIVKKGFYDVVKVFDPNHDGILTHDEMRYMVNELFNILKRDLQFWRLYFALASQPIVNRMAYEKIMEIAIPVFVTLTEYFRTNGYENPEVEARMFTAFLDGVSMNYVYEPDSFPLEAIKARILEMYNLNNNNKS